MAARLCTAAWKKRSLAVALGVTLAQGLLAGEDDGEAEWADDFDDDSEDDFDEAEDAEFAAQMAAGNHCFVQTLLCVAVRSLNDHPHPPRLRCPQLVFPWVVEPTIRRHLLMLRTTCSCRMASVTACPHLLPMVSALCRQMGALRSTASS